MQRITQMKNRKKKRRERESANRRMVFVSPDWPQKRGLTGRIPKLIPLFWMI